MSRLFLMYVRRYVAKHFNAVRVSKAGGIPDIPDGPLLVVANHPSWWDPLIAFLLASQIGRALYAPVEAGALARYPLFRRLGMFGVESCTLAGARTFLTTGHAILSSPGTVLVVTAQGRFADVRERPIRVMPGVGRLARRIGRGTIVPVALEYSFWNERVPEALIYFGQPIPIEPELVAAEWTTRIAAELARVQSTLAAEATRRDPAAFESILTGRVGIGGVYDLWRRLVAAASGRRFDPRHDQEDR